MKKWSLLALPGLLSACQMLDPASLDGLFASPDGSGTGGDDTGQLDTANPGTGGGTGGDGGGGESGAGGDDGGGTGGDDGVDTGGGDTGEPAPEPVPCSEDISLRLSGERDELRLDFTDLRPGQPDGQSRRSAVQVPSGASGVTGAWQIGHGPDFLIGVRLPPGKTLSVRLDPLSSAPDGEPDHLVAFLDGCPEEPDLCSTDDPTSRFGDCISAIDNGRWWSGAGEGWQASLDNPGEDDLYVTLLVDTTSPLELTGGNLVYEMTDL